MYWLLSNNIHINLFEVDVFNFITKYVINKYNYRLWYPFPYHSLYQPSTNIIPRADIGSQAVIWKRALFIIPQVCLIFVSVSGRKSSSQTSERKFKSKTSSTEPTISTYICSNFQNKMYILHFGSFVWGFETKLSVCSHII